MRKNIEVGCAIIEKDGKLLVTQRRPGDSWGGYWEFPGGKKRPNEDYPACVRREMMEELGIQVRTAKFLRYETHDYIDRTVHLHFYLCRVVSGKPVGLESYAFEWVRLEDLHHYRFLPADWDFINDLIRKKRDYFNVP